MYWILKEPDKLDVVQQSNKRQFMGKKESVRMNWIKKNYFFFHSKLGKTNDETHRSNFRHLCVKNFILITKYCFHSVIVKLNFLNTKFFVLKFERNNLNSNLMPKNYRITTCRNAKIVFILSPFDSFNMGNASDNSHKRQTTKLPNPNRIRHIF